MNGVKFFAGLRFCGSGALHDPILEVVDAPLTGDCHFARPTKVEKDGH